MSGLPKFSHPNLLVGSDHFDDAGVYQLTADIAIIQTVDFFTPMVDDPYLFGQIAAANALSDVYAMGGTPITALNLAAFPTCKDMKIFADILAGGADKVIEAGALLIGGHTIEDDEPKYGLSVCGVCHPQKIISNTGAKEGDLLFLTKHLGTGIIATAIKGDLITEEEANDVLQEMAQLNKVACEAMVASGICGATDITGFGLLGHMNELLRGSGVGAQLWAEQVPIWPAAIEFAKDGIIPGGAYRNHQFLKEGIDFGGLPKYLQMILCDPQTSGGMLMSVPKDKGGKMESFLELAGREYAIIGSVTAGSGIRIVAK